LGPPLEGIAEGSQLRLLWTFVTDLGDSAVTIPLAGLTLLFLLIAREWQVARAWVVMVVGCAVVISALKLLFGACGQHLALADVVSPSGHTAMSVTIYLSFALLLGGGTTKRVAGAIYLGGVALVVGIGVSRIVLHSHDLAEVILGSAVGLSGHACFRWMLAGRRTVSVSVIAMAIGAVVVVAVQHGTRWQVEPRLSHVATWLHLALPWCR
jgi:membrane-associated phospholipid phosphatase